MYSRDVLNKYWDAKLDKIKQVLEKNNFEVFISPSLKDAKQVFIDNILNKLDTVDKIAFGGSLTVVESGIYDYLKELGTYNIIDTYDWSIPQEEFIERRRQALLSDLFITGTNAVTEDGVLINLDGFGNRVGAIAFGPRYVTLLVGRNKIVSDLQDGINRIKNYAAPINTIRLNRKTPCTKTLECEDCNSPDRICNVWVITEKSVPPKRIKIILINEDCGF